MDTTSIPSAHDRKFISYPLGYDTNFEECFPATRLEEGGYSNDLHDKGGMTMYGIIQREYDLKRRQWGLPTQWVKNISMDETRTIYYTDYWLPYSPKLPIGLAQEFWDLNVNGGQHRAVETLQKALGIEQDGQWGNQTEQAVAALNTSGETRILHIIELYKIDREEFYRSLSDFRYFGTDWIRRSENIEKQGEKLEETEFSQSKPSV